MLVHLRAVPRIVRRELCKRTDRGERFRAKQGAKVDLPWRLCFVVSRIEVEVDLHTTRQFAAPYARVKVLRHEWRRLNRCNYQLPRRLRPKSTQGHLCLRHSRRSPVSHAECFYSFFRHKADWFRSAGDLTVFLCVAYISDFCNYAVFDRSMPRSVTSHITKFVVSERRGHRCMESMDTWRGNCVSTRSW